MKALNVDEVVGQLLASEGFNSVEDLAMVEEKEIASIEGFDEDTARELQSRAAEFLAKQEAELDAKRQELGVEDALKEVRLTFGVRADDDTQALDDALQARGGVVPEVVELDPAQTHRRPPSPETT